MSVNYLFMGAKIHNQIAALERRLSELGKARTEFYKEMNISKEAYQNWRQRGIPSNRIFDAAAVLDCDPESLRKGKITRQTAPGIVAEQPATYGAMLNDPEFIAAWNRIPPEVRHCLREFIIFMSMPAIKKTLSEIWGIKINNSWVPPKDSH